MSEGMTLAPPKDCFVPAIPVDGAPAIGLPLVSVLIAGIFSFRRKLSPQQKSQLRELERELSEKRETRVERLKLEIETTSIDREIAALEGRIEWIQEPRDLTEEGEAFVLAKGINRNFVVAEIKAQAGKDPIGPIGEKEIEEMLRRLAIDLSRDQSQWGSVSIGRNPGPHGAETPRCVRAISDRQVIVTLTDKVQYRIQSHPEAKDLTCLVRKGIPYNIPVQGGIIMNEGDLILFGGSVWSTQEKDGPKTYFSDVSYRFHQERDRGHFEFIGTTKVPPDHRSRISEKATAVIVSEGHDPNRILSQIQDWSDDPYIAFRPLYPEDIQKYLEWRRADLEARLEDPENRLEMVKHLIKKQYSPIRWDLIGPGDLEALAKRILDETNDPSKVLSLLDQIGRISEAFLEIVKRVVSSELRKGANKQPNADQFHRLIQKMEITVLNREELTETVREALLDLSDRPTRQF